MGSSDAVRDTDSAATRGVSNGEALIPMEQIKFECWQNRLNAGGQHTNGPPPYFYAEHLPTGVCVILPNRALGQLKARDLAVEALAFILTHPLAERIKL